MTYFSEIKNRRVVVTGGSKGIGREIALACPARSYSYHHRQERKRTVRNGIEFPDYGLDGMRCDLAGNLYVTRWGKGTVVKLSPQGRLLQEIMLTGKNCTNLTFGGDDGRTCYVTVADRGNVEMFSVETPGRCRSGAARL
jgi:sugar lactone lactonase YvrE